MGPTDVNAGLYRRAYVVGVDMAVPDTVAAHDHDGVAERRPRLPEVLDRPIGSVEEEHHLVPGSFRAVGPMVVGPRSTDRDHQLGWIRQGTTVDCGQDGVEEEQEAATTGVHDAGIGNDLQQVRGPRQALASDRAGLEGDGQQVGTGIGDDNCGIGGLAHHRQDGSLDRRHDSGVGSAARCGEAIGEGPPVHGLCLGEHAGEAAQDLREDDAGVASGAHQRTMRDGRGDLFHTGRIGQPFEFSHDRLGGHGHVGSRVPVRNRIDVQEVERLTVRGQRFQEGAHQRAQRHSVKGFHNHGGRA